MSLRDQAGRLAQAGVERAQVAVASNGGLGARLMALIQMRDDAQISFEALVLKLVDAVRGDEEKERSRGDVESAAKWRQRGAGLAKVLGGSVGAQVFSLYGEAAIFCDVDRLHKLGLTNEQLASHLLVFWNSVPDYDAAHGAFERGDQSLAGLIGSHVRGALTDKPLREMTKLDVVRALWRARGIVAGGASQGDDPKRRDIFLPGARVRAAIAAAERQFGLATPGRFARLTRGRRASASPEGHGRPANADAVEPHERG